MNDLNVGERFHGQDAVDFLLDLPWLREAERWNTDAANLSKQLGPRRLNHPISREEVVNEAVVRDGSGFDIVGDVLRMVAIEFQHQTVLFCVEGQGREMVENAGAKIRNDVGAFWYPRIGRKGGA